MPRSLATHPDESLAGYLLNLSYRLRVAPAQVAGDVGLLPGDDSRSPRIPAGYSERLPRSTAEAMSVSCRLSTAETRDLTLERWDGHLLDHNDSDAGHAGRPARPWLAHARTGACPSCLPRSAGPVDGTGEPVYATWRLRWRTPWSFACTRHGVLLVDRCSTCDTPLGLSQALAAQAPRSGLIPSMSTVGLHPAACRARVLAEHQRDSGPASLAACGARIDRQPLGPPADGRVMAAQEHLDGVFSGTVTATSLGAVVSPGQYLRDLRLVAFALQAVGPEDWPLEPPADTVQAVRRAADERQRSSANPRREAGRWRMWAEPPAEKALLAAVLTTAVHVLDAEDATAARPLLRPLVTAAEQAETRLWMRVRAAGSPSRRLAHLTSPGFGGLISVNKMIQAGAVVAPGVTGRHVPQMALPEVDELVAPLAPTTSPRDRRRATSLALVRLIEDCGLPEAAGSLGIVPLHRATSSVARLGKELRAADKDDDFRSALVGVVSGLRADGTDWTARRAAMSRTSLSDEDWEALLSDLGRLHPRSAVNTPLRRTAWDLLLWTRVVSGDMFLSPYLTPLSPTERRTVLKSCRAAQRPAIHADVLDHWCAEFVRRIGQQTAIPAQNV